MKLKNTKFDNFQFIIGNLLRCPDLQKVTHGFALMYRLIEFYEFETSNQDMTIECTYSDLSSQMGVTDRMITKSIDQLCELGLIQKKKKVSKTQFTIMPKVVNRYWMKTSEFKMMIASSENVDYTKNTTIANLETTENTTIETTENTTIDIPKTLQTYIYETNETNYEIKENHVKEKTSSKSEVWSLIENKMKFKDGRLVADFQDAPVEWSNRNDGTCYSLLDVNQHDKQLSKINVISRQLASSYFTEQHKAMYRENFKGNMLSQDQKDALGSMAKDQNKKIFITGSAGSGKTHLMVGLLKHIIANRHFANRLHGVGRFFYGTLDQLDRWKKSEYEKAKAENKPIPSVSDLLSKMDIICIDDFSVSKMNSILEYTIDQFIDLANSFNGCMILASRNDLNGLPIPSHPKSDLNKFKACFSNTTISLSQKGRI
jgi:DNA replication protein DnaC/predicted transcriptional regulator